MRMKRLVPGAAVVLVIAGLLGCSSNGEAAPEPSASPSPTATADVTESGQIDDVPQLSEGWAGVRKDVTIAQCPTTAGDVTANGTVVNTAAEARDITIVVSWNAPGTTDPLLRLSTTKEDVPAGETADWSVTGTLPADSAECVLSARSGQLAAP